jgi:hypothetical protein
MMDRLSSCGLLLAPATSAIALLLAGKLRTGAHVARKRYTLAP